jgi:hypothetical protein
VVTVACTVAAATAVAAAVAAAAAAGPVSQSAAVRSRSADVRTILDEHGRNTDTYSMKLTASC